MRIEFRHIPDADAVAIVSRALRQSDVVFEADGKQVVAFLGASNADALEHVVIPRVVRALLEAGIVANVEAETSRSRFAAPSY